MTQSAAQHMVENGVTNGSVINIASIVGKVSSLLYVYTDMVASTSHISIVHMYMYVHLCTDCT